MNFANNDDFLKMIDDEYRDVDWENLPPPKPKPYWVIRGPQRCLDGVIAFEIDKHYESEGEALAFIEKMKTMPAWCGGNQDNDPDDGPVLWETVSAIKLHTTDVLHLYKQLLLDIKDGKQVFPMYFP